MIGGKTRRGLSPGGLEWFRKMAETGLLTPVDRALAETLLRMAGNLSPPSPDVLAMACALASAASREGHALLDLRPPVRSPFFETLPEGAPPPDRWQEILAGARAVVGDKGRLAPLVLDRGLLYLCRYYRAEVNVAEILSSRLVADRKLPSGTLSGRERRALDSFFPLPGDPSGAENAGRQAALASLSRSFLILTGGPGTGKTWTAARMIALHRTLFPERRIVAAAPTGKAAARIGQALAESGLTPPPPTMTLHRLLEAGSSGFLRGPENPLDWDFVLVDELSMIDLPLMERLLLALPETSRLVLTGDRDQLSSVGAGSVMNDLCSTLTGSSDADPEKRVLHVLTHNYRQTGPGRIREFSRAVGAGEVDRALEILLSSQVDNPEGDLEWIRPEGVAPDRSLSLPLDRLAGGWMPFCNASSPPEAIRTIDSFMVLAALREGPCGTRELNRRIHGRILSRVLQESRNVPAIILENSYDTGLMNGDLGFLCRSALYFRKKDQIAEISMRLAPEWDLAYAMTVHKSQGSEFDHVMAAFGILDHPLLTRAILYTASTRARKKLTIWASRDILEKMIQRKSERSSALGERLSRSLSSHSS